MCFFRITPLLPCILEESKKKNRKQRCNMRNDFIHVHHNKSESPETQPSKDIKTDHGP